MTRADYGDRPLRRQPDELSTGNQEAVIRAWLALIEETDLATIAKVIGQCQRDADARAYFTGRAAPKLSKSCAAADEQSASVGLLGDPAELSGTIQ